MKIRNDLIEAYSKLMQKLILEEMPYKTRKKLNNISKEIFKSAEHIEKTRIDIVKSIAEKYDIKPDEKGSYKFEDDSIEEINKQLTELFTDEEDYAVQLFDEQEIEHLKFNGAELDLFSIFVKEGE